MKPEGRMMAVSRRVLVAVGVPIAMLLQLARAQAVADTPTAPTAPIEALDAALVAIMKAGSGTPFGQRYQMLAPTVDEVFDFGRIIQVSVGLYWGSLPPAQQQKLSQVFRAFTIATYVANFASYGGEVAAVAASTRAVGAERVVSSTLTKPSGDVVRIDYVMGQTGGGWKVQDILLDGTISRVAVQRSDFSSLLSQGDAKPLIVSLEQKVSTLSGGAISS